MVWPANSVVSLAYVDQLTRSKAIQPDRAVAVKDVLGRADKIRSARDRNASAAVTELSALAAQLESDAAKSTGRDAARLKSLAANIKERTTRLR